MFRGLNEIIAIKLWVDWAADNNYTVNVPAVKLFHWQIHEPSCIFNVIGNSVACLKTCKFALNGWSFSQLFNSALCRNIYWASTICQCLFNFVMPLSQRQMQLHCKKGAGGKHVSQHPWVHGIERQDSWRVCVHACTDSIQPLILLIKGTHGHKKWNSFCSPDFFLSVSRISSISMQYHF